MLARVRDTPEPLPYAEHLPSVYRFAFLMTGSATAAAEVLQHTVEGAEREGLGDLRNLWQVRRWLFTHARASCRRPSTVAIPVPSAAPVEDPPFSSSPEASVPTVDDASDSAQQLALLFGGLPETERGAAILFYLYLFTPAELAEILEIKPDDLGTLLTRGRALLQKKDVGCGVRDAGSERARVCG